MRATMDKVDLETEIQNKIEKNKRRKYKEVEGVMTRVSEG